MMSVGIRLLFQLLILIVYVLQLSISVSRQTEIIIRRTIKMMLLNFRTHRSFHSIMGSGQIVLSSATSARMKILWHAHAHCTHSKWQSVRE